MEEIGWRRQGEEKQWMRQGGGDRVEETGGGEAVDETGPLSMSHKTSVMVFSQQGSDSATASPSAAVMGQSPSGRWSPTFSVMVFLITSSH